MTSYFPFFYLTTPFLITIIVLLVPKVRVNINPAYYSKVLVGLLILLIVSLFISFQAKKSLDETENSSFNGVIEKAYYERPKLIPHITIKGIEYDLFGLNYPDYDTIRAGDSAIKLKGTFKFKLIKRELR